MTLLCMAGLLSVSNLSQAQTAYYGEPAMISGKLLKIKSLHPNQEEFGGNQIAVALNQQLNVDGEDGLVKTKLIQLVDSDPRYSSLFKRKVKPYKFVAVSYLEVIPHTIQPSFM